MSFFFGIKVLLLFFSSIVQSCMAWICIFVYLYNCIVVRYQNSSRASSLA